MPTRAPFPFDGDPALLEPSAAALHRVVDPEMALDIVELGLVYGVAVEGSLVKVLITMTSPACPVTEYIAEEATHEVQRALGAELHARVTVTWDPPWTPERMSARAREAMGWD